MAEEGLMGGISTNTHCAGLLVMMALLACAGRQGDTDDTAAAPVDTVSNSSGRPDVATPPIVPQPEISRDTPPAGTAAPAPQSSNAGAPRVSKVEYEGWRQYSVNCARCHGQDVLPNPVAANLLVSVAPGGPVSTEAEFAQVVTEGRPERGMPAFKGVLTPDQTRAIYAYVHGRAEKRIPPGRPASPG